jgi:hypothetical protein
MAFSNELAKAGHMPERVATKATVHLDQVRSVGHLRVPAALFGAHSIFIEAVDAAKNRGFARARIEVRP